MAPRGRALLPLGLCLALRGLTLPPFRGGFRSLFQVLIDAIELNGGLSTKPSLITRRYVLYTYIYIYYVYIYIYMLYKLRMNVGVGVPFFTVKTLILAENLPENQRCATELRRPLPKKKSSMGPELE